MKNLKYDDIICIQNFRIKLFRFISPVVNYQQKMLYSSFAFLINAHVDLLNKCSDFNNSVYVGNDLASVVVPYQFP